jgi:ankyrin repeat protein
MNLDVSLDIDDEITKSGPYVRHYRSLMRQHLRSSSGSESSMSNLKQKETAISETEVSGSTSPPGGLSRLTSAESDVSDKKKTAKKESRISIRSLAWKYSSDGRAKVQELCTHAVRGDYAKVVQAWKTGAYVNGYCSQGYTPLYSAVTGRNIEVAVFLLDKGADVHEGYKLEWEYKSKPVKTSKTHHGPLEGGSDGGGAMAPIHQAAKIGSREMIELLAQHGAYVNDASGADPSRHMDEDTMTGNFTCFEGRTKVTPLHLATGPAAETLIRLGASTTALDSFGRSPLVSAAFRDDIETTRTCITHGCPVNDSIPDGRTALSIFCIRSAQSSDQDLAQRLGVIDLFVKSGGADLSHRYPAPLGLEAELLYLLCAHQGKPNGLVDVAEKLIVLGADANAYSTVSSPQHSVPMSTLACLFDQKIAPDFDYARMTRLLIKAGARVNAQPTPLFILLRTYIEGGVYDPTAQRLVELAKPLVEAGTYLGPVRDELAAFMDARRDIGEGSLAIASLFLDCCNKRSGYHDLGHFDSAVFKEGVRGWLDRGWAGTMSVRIER